jgi:hypothetical protein
LRLDCEIGISNKRIAGKPYRKEGGKILAVDNHGVLTAPSQGMAKFTVKLVNSRSGQLARALMNTILLS